MRPLRGRRCTLAVLLLFAIVLETVHPQGTLVSGSSDEDDDDGNKRRSNDDDSEESEWHGSDGVPGSHECNGHGRRYCGDAHKVQECPEGCNPWECAEESSDMGDKSNDIVNSGKYDYVYWDKDQQKVCVSYCWRRWDDMQCKRGWSDRVRYYALDGDRVRQSYCKWLLCDEAGHKISGCHEPRDFFQPTCENCRRLFPAACAPRLRSPPPPSRPPPNPPPPSPSPPPPTTTTTTPAPTTTTTAPTQPSTTTWAPYLPNYAPSKAYAPATSPRPLPTHDAPFSTSAAPDVLGSHGASSEQLPPITLENILPSSTQIPVVGEGGVVVVESPPADATAGRRERLSSDGGAGDSLTLGDVLGHKTTPGTVTRSPSLTPFVPSVDEELLLFIHVDFQLTVPSQTSTGGGSKSVMLGNGTQWLHNIVASAAALPRSSVVSVVVSEAPSSMELTANAGSVNSLVYSVSAEISSETPGETAAALQMAAVSGALDELFGAVGIHVVRESMKIEMQVYPGIWAGRQDGAAEVALPPSNTSMALGSFLAISSTNPPPGVVDESLLPRDAAAPHPTSTPSPPSRPRFNTRDENRPATLSDLEFAPPADPMPAGVTSTAPMTSSPGGSGETVPDHSDTIIATTTPVPSVMAPSPATGMTSTTIPRSPPSPVSVLPPPAASALQIDVTTTTTSSPVPSRDDGPNTTLSTPTQELALTTTTSAPPRLADIAESPPIPVTTVTPTATTSISAPLTLAEVAVGLEHDTNLSDVVAALPPAAVSEPQGSNNSVLIEALGPTTVVEGLPTSSPRMPRSANDDLTLTTELPGNGSDTATAGSNVTAVDPSEVMTAQPAVEGDDGGNDVTSSTANLSSVDEHVDPTPVDGEDRNSTAASSLDSLDEVVDRVGAGSGNVALSPVSEAAQVEDEESSRTSQKVLKLVVIVGLACAGALLIGATTTLAFFAIRRRRSRNGEAIGGSADNAFPAVPSDSADTTAVSRHGSGRTGKALWRKMFGRKAEPACDGSETMGRKFENSTVTELDSEDSEFAVDDELSLSDLDMDYLGLDGEDDGRIAARTS